ncbi:uncharacterized protein LOC129749832 [Uranotaenia lowii]|uniref:uncharacterized protein LOC129749832 n=1 Tax=Uranotaenia lowii TaxID=190385 RepID=UPI0024794190|nr:uncharacterized protein LOC129749832 [Uranotaenia lowii]
MAKIRNVFRKHLIANLESKCRLCLSEKAEIVQSIFQCESKDVTDTLVEKIFECTAIMLSKDFDFPSPICEDCAFKLDEFLLFRAKCLRSNEIYRFNKLYKSKLLAGARAIVSNGDGDNAEGKEETDTRKEASDSDGKHSEPPDIQVTHDEVKEDKTPTEKDVLATSSSSEGANVTVIINEKADGATCSVSETYSVERIASKSNEKITQRTETNGTVSNEAAVLFETEASSLSEPLLSRNGAKDETIAETVDGVNFPLETTAELDRLEQRIRTCPVTRDNFILLLKSLKPHDTSLSDTYQRLFTDALMIHYNYDGISPKYNKRPLKSLTIFTECMPAAWKDHMSAQVVREAIIEAVKKSHSRYNQCNHRKRSRQVYL